MQSQTTGWRMTKRSFPKWLQWLGLGQTKLGSHSSRAAHVGGRSLDTQLSSAAFPGVPTWRWIGSKATWTPVGTLWDAGITGRGPIYRTTMAAPNIKHLRIIKSSQMGRV